MVVDNLHENRPRVKKDRGSDARERRFDLWNWNKAVATRKVVQRMAKCNGKRSDCALSNYHEYDNLKAISGSDAWVDRMAARGGFHSPGRAASPVPVKLRRFEHTPVKTASSAHAPWIMNHPVAHVPSSRQDPTTRLTPPLPGRTLPLRGAGCGGADGNGWTEGECPVRIASSKRRRATSFTDSKIFFL